MDSDKKNLISSTPGSSKKTIAMDSEARKRTIGLRGVQPQEEIRIQTKLIRLNDSWEVAPFDGCSSKEKIKYSEHLHKITNATIEPTSTSSAAQDEGMVRLEFREESLDLSTSFEDNNDEEGPLVIDEGPVGSKGDPNPEYNPELNSSATIDATSSSSQPEPCREIIEVSPELEFQLKFTQYHEPTPSLKINFPHRLCIHASPLNKCFDIVIRRKHYPNYPICHFDSEGMIKSFFTITSAETVKYMQIKVPNNAVHYGARVRVENTKEIMISFLKMSTYLTNEERIKYNMKVHTAKILELICLDPQQGTLLGSIEFQSVVIERPKTVRNYLRQQESSISCLPEKRLSHSPGRNAEVLDGSGQKSDSKEEDVTPRKPNLEKIQRLLPLLSDRKLKLLVDIAEVMAE